MENRIKRIPRDALTQWKKYVADVKTGAILDTLRANQLKFKLSQIPLRTTKDSLTRIVGQGNVIVGKLKEMENRLKNIPREALRKWKNFI